MTDAEKEADAEIERVLKATRAIDEWEKVHGVRFDVATVISCPCCCVEDALKFLRQRAHLYVQCGTPNCVPQFRGSTRGKRW